VITTPESIYDFWFGGPNRDEFGQSRKQWFVKDPNFDAEIRDRFLDTHAAAARGELQHWRDEPKHCLALIVTLDQFPRNMFRDTPQAFATDPAALETARVAIDRGHDQSVNSVERVFFYLPFEHSETLADQVRCVALVQDLVNADPSRADFLDYAKRHRDVIARFGRFPHRNKILGRDSTTAEIEFLRQLGSSF
jgi:uncharacterized protein (DUF924 family)